MCDTMVALGNATKDGRVIFAKNSDREPNEPQLTIRVPRRQYAPGTKLKCTYIEIDQVAETYEVLLLKPSWMWGAEMGGNEFGLHIGNEAVFTREKQGPEALLGMDMLRLALERCKTSGEALDLLVELLAKHGQGGNCGYEKKFFYHNSFLIADPREAWVLETAGEYWAAEQVKDVRTISNRLSISRNFNRAHPDLIRHAVARKWCRGEADFDFARCYSDPLVTRFSGSLRRQGSSSCVLEAEKGRITMQTMRSILRSHEEKVEGRQFSRHSISSICMHGGFMIGSHTTGSLIAAVDQKRTTYLLTGGSTPCLALFKPYWLVEDVNLSFGEDQQAEALEFWKQRERLHRAVLENRVTDLAGYLAGRNRIEAEIDEQLAAIDLTVATADELKEIVDRFHAAEEQLLAKTMQTVAEEARPARIGGNPYFRAYWKKQTRRLFG